MKFSDVSSRGRRTGFTLVELVVVVLILGILAATALPRFLDIDREARVAVLERIAATMRATATQAYAKARLSGLKPYPANPGNQAALIVDFGFGATEVDWRNLCPESRAELGDALTMLDFMQSSLTGGLSAQTNNQYTLIGYAIPGFSVPTNQGCYVIYDSFGDPECTVTVVDVDC